MKKYLLDTHILIWLITNNTRKLKNKNLKFLREDCVASVESLKEIALLQDIGRFDIDTNAERLIKRLEAFSISILDFDKASTIAFFNLPYYSDHADPSDRSIIAQAIAKNLILLSVDSKFDRYKTCGLRLEELI
ncbi:MAG: type II toxin-antitoxin system VapC family toxin [Bacteroidales bacterium]|jgi:PIN domain nuclease of toxin-antitoxin system|nr:type II toxin-antitoxin system VapC family toxin [Bacteroidales bacterium]